MAIQNTTSSLLCLNTGIDGHKPSENNIKNAKARLKEEFSDVSIVFWSELQNPLFGSLREVTAYLHPDSWKGLASVSLVSDIKESRNGEYRWETTKQDILFMWKDNVWEEVLPDNPIICDALEVKTDHQTNRMHSVSTRFHYPAGFPSKRVAWTILKQTGENFDHRLVAFVAFHGIQYNATNDEKKHDIIEVFDFFHKKIRSDMKISVVIGGDFNATPKDIVSWTKGLNIDIEGVLPREEGKIVNTTEHKCLDHIWILNPDITKKDPSMHAISIENKLMSAFRHPPGHLKHAPFRANVLFLDVIHPGTNCDHTDVKEYKKHLSKFFLQESVGQVSAQTSTEDKFMVHVADPIEIADLIIERIKHSANELSACNKCKQAAHRGTLENPTVSEKYAAPSKGYKRKKQSRNYDLGTVSNCNAHQGYSNDDKTMDQQIKNDQSNMRNILLKRVSFKHDDHFGDHWKLTYIDELLSELSPEKEQLALQKLLKAKKGRDIKIYFDYKKKHPERWHIFHQNKEHILKEFLNRTYM